jgi:hypothetical protein
MTLRSVPIDSIFLRSSYSPECLEGVFSEVHSQIPA